MTERAAGKDTTTGHWEIAGLTLEKPFPTYPDGFPPEVIEAFEREVGIQTIGNKLVLFKRNPKEPVIDIKL